MGYLNFKAGDRVGLIACSDGLMPNQEHQVEAIIHILANMGLEVELTATIFRTDGPFSGSPQVRAAELHRLFQDPAIKAIFDISGGDAANQVLPHLDYQLIADNPKPFLGYSDLSVLLNALNSRAGLVTYHYQLRQIVWDESGEQKELFFNSLMGEEHRLFEFEYAWLRGESMVGSVVGGNIRCFLKLAGTNYFPDCEGKLVFLESLSGGMSRIASLLAQLDQIGVFRQAAGLVLGTFTQLEREVEPTEVQELFLRATASYGLPIVKTQQLGHGLGARCLRIGEQYEFS